MKTRMMAPPVATPALGPQAEQVIVPVRYIQEKLPAWFERVADLVQHLFVVHFVLKVAKSREQVHTGIELSVPGQASHVAAHQVEVHLCFVGRFLSLAQQILGAIQANHSKASPGQGHCMPALTAAQIQDLRTGLQVQQGHHARHFLGCLVRRQDCAEHAQIQITEIGIPPGHFSPQTKNPFIHKDERGWLSWYHLVW